MVLGHVHPFAGRYIPQCESYRNSDFADVSGNKPEAGSGVGDTTQGHPHGKPTAATQRQCHCCEGPRMCDHQLFQLVGFSDVFFQYAEVDRSHRLFKSEP
jgi:hypothetical protein